MGFFLSCVSWFLLLFLSLPIKSVRWVQFNLELPVIRKGVAPVAVAAKARIADDEGGLRIKRRMMAPGEGGLAGAMHEGKPNAVRWDHVVQAHLMGLPIRLIAPKAFVPR